MNTTIGTSQSILAFTTNNTASLQNYYFTKFVSDPINQTSVAANTWTYNFAARTTNVAGFTNYPVSGTNQPVRIHVYVWRPSTSTKVGTILDGNTASTIDEVASADLKVCQATFTGAAVSSTQADDVIVCEIWFALTAQFGGADACDFAYDGATVNTTKNAVVTNHASFIETPENITFVTGMTSVSQTSIHEYNIMKNVVQTSIHKYNLRTFLVQTTIQKYNLLKFLVQTNIHKYSLRQFLTQTTIQKYRMGGMVLAASIQKYNLRKFLAQTTIHKYTLRNMVAITASIQKYAIRKAVMQASIQKYNLKKLILQTTIHKYGLGGIVLQASKHKYTIRVFAAIASTIQKYNLRRFVAQSSSIQKYAMRSAVIQTSTQKYKIGTLVGPPIDMTQTNTKTYANKFIVKV